MTVALPALVAKHKTALLGAGAAGAVVLGLKARRGGGASTVAAPAHSGTYDSVAGDVYNSIQPQIDALARQLDLLGTTTASPQDALNPVTPAPIPVATLPGPAFTGGRKHSPAHIPGPVGAIVRGGRSAAAQPLRPLNPVGRALLASDLAQHPSGGIWWISSPDSDLVAQEQVASAKAAGQPVKAERAKTSTGVEYNRVTF